ncbi:hypothetical protein [Haliscomenobacter sp.]|uniref:hypothetical protein n=1 Tax=Haliscomenobacter sp. TaxID=2717303 RepID=UPI003BAD48F5
MIKTIFKITAVLTLLVLGGMPNNLSSQSFNEFADGASDAWHQATSSSGDDGGTNPYDSAYEESTSGSSSCNCGVPAVKNAMPIAGQSKEVTIWKAELRSVWSWTQLKYVTVSVKVEKRCYVTPYSCMYVKMEVGPCCACVQSVCG